MSLFAWSKKNTFKSSKKEIKVNCWFCNEDTNIFGTTHSATGSQNTEQNWWCPNCQQYNGFTAEGDYNRVIPQMYDEALNAPPVIKGPNRQPVARSDAGFGSSGFAAAAAEKGNAPILCNWCIRNQNLKLQQLASFQPKSEETYEEEYSAFSEEMEELYALCETCEVAVGKQLELSNKKLLTDIYVTPKINQSRRSAYRRQRLTRKEILIHMANSLHNFFVFSQLPLLTGYLLLHVLKGYNNPISALLSTLTLTDSAAAAAATASEQIYMVYEIAEWFHWSVIFVNILVIICALFAQRGVLFSAVIILLEVYLCDDRPITAVTSSLAITLLKLLLMDYVAYNQNISAAIGSDYSTNGSLPKLSLSNWKSKYYKQQQRLQRHSNTGAMREDTMTMDPSQSASEQQNDGDDDTPHFDLKPPTFTYSTAAANQRRQFYSDSLEAYGRGGASKKAPVRSKMEEKVLFGLAGINLEDQQRQQQQQQQQQQQRQQQQQQPSLFRFFTSLHNTRDSIANRINSIVADKHFQKYFLIGAVVLAIATVALLLILALYVNFRR